MSVEAINESPAVVDYMIPAKGYVSGGGSWMNRLLDSELDVGCMRPYVDKRGRTCITRNVLGPDGKIVPKKIVTNDTNATLRVLDWIQLDEAVLRAAKPRLRAAGDLRKMGLVYQLPNGIAKTVMQYQQQSDIGGATMSMDGLRQGESDRPVFSLVNFPLPIIHKDFSFPLRQVLASRTGYSPLDMTTAELAGRRVAEQVEQLTLGAAASTGNQAMLGVNTYSWAAGTIQGYLNYTNRITYSLTLPTAAGWTPQNTIDDILLMKKASQQANHFGPWMVYFGLAWDPYMDDDYKPTFNDTTLRQRIKAIDGIMDARTVDYMGTGYDILMVQMTTDVTRMVIGMDITTVQWESHGGMQLNFKVMCVMLPQLRTDFYGLTGIVHGS